MRAGQCDLSGDRTHILESHGGGHGGARIQWLERDGDVLRVSNADRTVCYEVPWANVDHAVPEAAATKEAGGGRR
jgi:hypothetical protein